MDSLFNIGEKCICIHNSIRYNATISSINTKGITHFYKVHFAGFNKRTDIAVEVGKENGILEKGTIDNTNDCGASSQDPVARQDSKTRKRNADTLKNENATITNNEQVYAGTMATTGSKKSALSVENNKQMTMIDTNCEESIAKKIRVEEGRENQGETYDRSLVSAVSSDLPDSLNLFLPLSLIEIYTKDYDMLNEKRGVCVQSKSSIYDKKYDLIERIDHVLNMTVCDLKNKKSECDMKAIKSHYNNLKDFIKEFFEYFEVIAWRVLLNKEELEFCHQKLLEFCTENRVKKPEFIDTIDYEYYGNQGFRVASHFNMIILVRMLVIFPYVQKDFPFSGRSKKIYKSGMLRLIQSLDLAAHSVQMWASYAPAKTSENPSWIPEKYVQGAEELKDLEIFEKNRLWKDENGQPIDIQTLSVFTS
ncbi:hypothetical protein CRE_14315 [Caenorhabditis remanei]|uniref:Tudor-knot domain-containing protein n=1 Tax=Caenorhabditis remanei TaxID=31234 RepID=E3NEY2_CAERE|nr:hypothetical protein CRE_14315 [Caenorhabditis remanei]